MRVKGRIGIALLAGALAVPGCKNQGDQHGRNPEEDGAVPVGAIPSAPDVMPGVQPTAPMTRGAAGSDTLSREAPGQDTTATQPGTGSPP